MRPEKYGFASIQPLTALHEFLARRRGGTGGDDPVDASVRARQVNHGRVDAAISTARRLEQSVRAAAERGRAARRVAARAVPVLHVQDVTPHSIGCG